MAGAEQVVGSERESRPSPIDVHVGSRIRLRRTLLGMSQERLGESLGLTFQQVQKYERGSNRISASKLYEISKVLNVSVAFFFDGYIREATDAEFSESESERDVQAFLTTGEGLELAETFPRLPSARHRRKILDLVKALAED